MSTSWKKKIVQFADEIFKAYCVTNFDTDGDGEISLQEALKIRVVYCNNIQIRSLEGIECFTNLTDLYCSDNKIRTLDLSRNPFLSRLSCYGNCLNTLDLKNNPYLESLHCGANEWDYIDLRSNHSLEELTILRQQIDLLDGEIIASA